MNIFTIDEKINCLLEDFNRFIDYLNTNQVTIGKKTKHISTKFLFEINGLMSTRQEGVTSKSIQLAYPMLHMFCNLAVSSKLFVEKSVRDSKLILKATDRIHKFNELNDTEKYIFLLEVLWMDCDFKNLRYQSGDITDEYETKTLLNDISYNKANSVIYSKHEWLYCSTILLYFSYFGIMGIKEDEELKLKYKGFLKFLPKEIIISSIGLEIIKILNKKRAITEWNISYRRKYGEWDISFDEEFYLPFKKLFKSGELENTLPRSKLEFKEGIYTFKISLNKNIWSKVRLSANDTLYDLHNCIQDAFEFDDDHLYSFFMDGEKWSSNKFSCANDIEGPCVDDAVLGKLELHEKQKFLYVFDYGAEWVFNIEVFNIEETNIKLLNPEIIESKGEPPAQYPDYDDDGDDTDDDNDDD